MSILLYIFAALAVAALLEALHSARGGLRYFKMFQESQQKSPGGFSPPSTLVIPFKGLDPGLEANLSAYFQLDYPDFEILLVTRDPSDPGVKVVRSVREKHPQVPSRLLYSGPARKHSQKVHNLLHAVSESRSAHRILAFGDSDIRPSRSWLRYLVASLKDPEVGVSTGFRWYLPQRGGFASVLRAVWNAGAASLMKSGDCYFAWGGAMAIRREIFDRCGVVEYWSHAVSDDYALSRAVHEHSLSIRFQPHCMSFSHEDCTLVELLNWSRRQLCITRVYHPRLWKAAWAAQLINNTVIWGGLGLIVSELAGSWVPNRTLFWWITGTVVVIYLLGCFKGWIRLRAIELLFPEHRVVLRKHRPAYVGWGPVAGLVSLAGLTGSLLSTQIEWRGVRYHMVSPNRTEVLREE